MTLSIGRISHRRRVQDITGRPMKKKISQRRIKIKVYRDYLKIYFWDPGHTYGAGWWRLWGVLRRKELKKY